MSFRPPDSTPQQTADALWGAGNWVTCNPCPRNDGHASIHAKDLHEEHEKPTGVLKRSGAYLCCATPFRVSDHVGTRPFLCELPRDHPGRHGVPRFDRWEPE